MKCEIIIGSLDGFLDGGLTELEKETIEEHLRSCERCRAELERRKALREALSALDEGIQAPDGLLQGAMQRIHDGRRRGRRTVGWVAGGVAAALCLTLGLGAMIGTGGQKSVNGATPMAAMDMASGESMTAESAPSMAEVKGDAWVQEPAEAPVPMPDTDTTLSGAGKSEEGGVQEYGLKIIRTANMDIQTESFSEDLAALNALVAEFEGFITSRQEGGSEAWSERYGSMRWASLTIRVPSGRLDEFLERAKAVGIVRSSNINETDVTSEYVDTDRKLRAYQRQYDRVLAMMDQAQTVEELISIESELSRLEMCIEGCQGSLNYWDSQVNLSTVDVYLEEVRRAVPVAEDPTLSQRMSRALADSWYCFVEDSKDALVGLYGAIPYIAAWVLVLGLAALIAALVVRRVKRSRTKK